MRLLFAGLFVWLGLLVVAGLASIVLPDNTPGWLFGALVAVTFIPLCLAAHWLFGVRLNGWQSQNDYIQELEQKGLLVSTSYRARGAFQVKGFDDDEGSHYFIELEDSDLSYDQLKLERAGGVA